MRGMSDAQRHVAVAAVPDRPAHAAGRTLGAWDERLLDGLNLPAIPEEIRLALGDALAAVAVEAEYLIALTTPPAVLVPFNRPRGATLVDALEALGTRLVAEATALEVATQGYLSVLEHRFPGVRDRANAVDPWWPLLETGAAAAPPVEVILRQCGFSYRHAVLARLSPNVEAMGEQLALTVHALASLPPAGATPAEVLYAGLYELSWALNGALIPQHVLARDERMLGLLPGIALLRRLDAVEDRSLTADIHWAEVCCDSARAALARSATSGESRDWLQQAVRGWEETLFFLRSLGTP